MAMFRVASLLLTAAADPCPSCLAPAAGSALLQRKHQATQLQGELEAGGIEARRDGAESDPSKCRENSKPDGDCCAKESAASCADGYTRVMTGSFCWGNTYEYYECHEPGSVSTPMPQAGPDKSKCLENNKPDGDCCAKESAASCADGYTRVMSGSFCWGNTYEYYDCWEPGSAPATEAPEEVASTTGAPDDEGGPTTGAPDDGDDGADDAPAVYAPMTGGQPCQQLCVMEYWGKCQGLDVSPGKAHYVKDREGCMSKYSWGKDGTLTPCVINRKGECHKNTNKSWKCWDYTTEEALRAACEAAGASPDVEPWKSFD